MKRKRSRCVAASAINRVYQLYREDGLAVRKASDPSQGRAPILVEAKPNDRWTLGFVHDQITDGRRFRILNILMLPPKSAR